GSAGNLRTMTREVMTMLTKLTRRALPAVAFALAAFATLGAHPASAKDLRILAWQGYADDDWVKEFEAQTGANVNVVFIGTDDEIWAKIKGSEGKDFDLFAVNTAQLQRYIDAGEEDRKSTRLNSSHT